ncbi:MAG: methyltransferase type 11 [Xanthobacteraceae bacterium]|nr:methyltransferase type 11 [Xanthobacteraceae bacterium]
MELPPRLRAGVDQILRDTPIAEIRKAAETLSQRYRGEMRDGRLHLSERAAATAYLATRLPATYAAIRASLAAIADVRPGWTPRTLLDAGAGPGSVLWAARDQWPSIDNATMIEASEEIRLVGDTLTRDAGARTSWVAADIARGLPALDRADLVTLSYVLGELAPAAIKALIERLWALSQDVLLVVEPGTPAGWQRVLAVRDQLIGLGAHVIAPCAHAERCPLTTPDWCHFSQRVARSRTHRLAKDADVPWEDEKFIYLAVSRTPNDAGFARVLARPRVASGAVRLKLCAPDGRLEERLVTKRQGDAYKVARRVDWGDRL